ncbi:MAG TPA: hypothetical protein PLJ26_01520 [Candidatus Omnitrophota bacterium]|nr:hypothetical protein [Candidatus Omnitrophota bacterium]
MRIAALVMLFCFFSSHAHAYTTEHHFVNMSRNVANIIGSPFKALFRSGPGDIVRMYNYEVKEREKPENRGRLFYKVYALASAPIVETKALVDGVTSSVFHAGKFVSEFLSIFFCD